MSFKPFIAALVSSVLVGAGCATTALMPDFDSISAGASQGMTDAILKYETSLRPGTLEVNDFGTVKTIHPKPENWDVTNIHIRVVTDPTTGKMYVENPSDGIFYIEGTDRVSREADKKITDAIQTKERSSH